MVRKDGQRRWRIDDTLNGKSGKAPTNSGWESGRDGDKVLGRGENMSADWGKRELPLANISNSLMSGSHPIWGDLHPTAICTQVSSQQPKPSQGAIFSSSSCSARRSTSVPPPSCPASSSPACSWTLGSPHSTETASSKVNSEFLVFKPNQFISHCWTSWRAAMFTTPTFLKLYPFPCFLVKTLTWNCLWFSHVADPLLTTTSKNSTSRSYPYPLFILFIQ